METINLAALDDDDVYERMKVQVKQAADSISKRLGDCE
ncbi:hypothetical protein DFP80_110135 [Marinomonas rhizomae]|uniref:Uncharacterized protein n=1 Tax=Marinomonas rhizomae TaxID=491948 RepID=A0A366J4R4_9GAMM|nr:hypothetical protein DFP80_110135 [Marinomonas rhizomae]